MMYKRILLFLIITGFFCSSYAQTKISLETYFKNLRSVKVEIEGKTYNFLFDTGAGITMVSQNVVEKINKSAYGKNIGFRMSGEKIEMQLCDSLNIKMGGINFFHPCVGVFDIMSLLPKELKRIDGIISLKTFEDHKITLNLNENIVIVETADSFNEKAKNITLIPSRFVNGPNGNELNIFIGVRAYSHLWWFLFDSGNIVAVKIAKNIAPEWKLSFSEKGKTELVNYNFDISEDSISAAAIIDDIIYDGALSFDFIKQRNFILSIPDKKVWVQ